MALSDAWLRSVVGKERDKVLVKSDRDGLSVRVSPKGRVVFQYRYQWAGKARRRYRNLPGNWIKGVREELSVFIGELRSNHNPIGQASQKNAKLLETMTVESVIRALVWKHVCKK